MQQPPGIPLDLEAAGRLVGAYRWLEKQLFHLLGGWVESIPEAPAKIFVDQQSLEFGWHAELWGERLPQHRGIDGLTAPPNPGVAAVFGELALGGTATTTVERLTAVYRVLVPRMVTAYSTHLELAHGTSNDPTQRALRLILADEHAGWRAGEMHLQALLADGEAIRQSADRQRYLETLLVEASGIAHLSS